jgi:hypothetical protein
MPVLLGYLSATVELCEPRLTLAEMDEARVISLLNKYKERGRINFLSLKIPVKTTFKNS